MVTTTLVTLADFERMGEAADDYEVFDGELVRREDMGERHGRLGFDVGFELGLFVKPRNLGQLYTSDTIFVLATRPLVLVRPDVAFIRAERWTDEVRGPGVIRIVPDLAVEIVSPGDTGANIRRKMALYERAAVPLLWVVRDDPPSITVAAAGAEPRVLGIGDVLDGGDVLLGFQLPLAKLFG
jgi:Uma2 family endonuclease